MKIKGWTNWKAEKKDKDTFFYTRAKNNRFDYQITLYRNKARGFMIWLELDSKELIPLLKAHHLSYVKYSYHWYSFKSLKEAKALIDGFLVRLNRLKAFT